MSEIGDKSYSPTNSDSAAYAASAVVKAAAGVLLGFTGYNSKTTDQFIQLFNSATVPADTTVPAVIIKVTAESNFSLDLGERGRYFDTGISWSTSSTGPTKTIGSADCWVNALYR